ncbi:DUF2269 family protein [Methylomicrobium sp. RS1]|uniref:DUF2269 family protein n=1 Tax=Candidatus Methylomicrobium oryzae TaxID=2802053 RepID=UPI001921A4EB|nr:DUF2269 domain-containing protein [Methylomicrobium sp. RS1]
MSYLTLKSLHIFSLVLLFGTGLGSAFYKFMADLHGDVRAIYTTNRHVVLADWWFTTPTVLIQPITGYYLLQQLPFSLTTPWLLVSVMLYLLAGACWLPVVFLQIRMRELSRRAVEQNTGLTGEYFRCARIWFWLGVPAFAAMILIVMLMVLKPALWG